MSRLTRVVGLFGVGLLVSAVGLVVVAPQASAAGTTTTSVESSNNPSSVGQSVTFSATVQAVTIPPPLGFATFFDGSSVLGVAVLVPQFGTFCGCVPTAHSIARLSTADLAQGTHTIRAVYLGDVDDVGSTGSMTQTVTAIPTTTTVSVVPNPSVFGQGVTLSAAVATVPAGLRTPVGSLQFHVDGADLGAAVTLDGSGTASAPVAGLVVGGHTITASFTSTDPNTLSSVSPPGLDQVNRADTATALSTSTTPAVYGQPVTLTATPRAVAPGAGAPSGTVTFTDGPTTLGAATVGGGQASITLTSLTVGNHSLLGSYPGDGSFNSSSGSLTQQITQAPTTTTVSSSANPSVYGQPVTFTAIECPSPPSTQPTLPPTGSVTFTVDGATTPFNTQTLTSAPGLPGCSQATSTATATLTVGPPAHTITVGYTGDGNFLPSTGALPSGQTVNKDATTTTVVSDHNPAFFGDPLTLTVTVLAAPPGAGTPTGTIAFTEGTTTLGTATLGAGGQSVFTTSGLQVGTHTIVATYSGDGNFLPSASPTLNQQVRCTTTITGRVNGGLAITTGSTCLQGATVNGPVTVATGAALSMRDSTVNGGLSATGATAITSCTSTINGAVTIQNSNGFVLIGDAGDDGYSCGTNTLHGAVTLLHNNGQLEVGGNDISGGLTVTSTSGTGPTPENNAPEIEANYIKGDLTCSTNTPYPTNDGQPNTATGHQTGQCATPF